MSQTNNVALLTEMSGVLVLHQDMEDVFEDASLSAEQKLRVLRLKNDELGGLLRSVLPE